MSCGHIKHIKRQGEATPTHHTHALTHTSKPEREEAQRNNRKKPKQASWLQCDKRKDQQKWGGNALEPCGVVVELNDT